MIARALLVLSLCCTTLSAATSDILLPLAGNYVPFPGLPGNVVFDGENFVTVMVSSNGAMNVLALNTNGFPVSTNALAIVGSTPRLIWLGSDYLLAWIETNSSPSLLKCARWSNNTLAAQFVLATNVAAETVTLSGKQAPFVAVWQSTGTNSAIYSRRVDADGSPLGEIFAVAPSAQPQRFPAIDTDGTNHLVSWMEQSATSNDWRVLVRLLSNSVPVGSVVQASETNSLTPHETAVCFGTNYLVAWSATDGPYSEQDLYIYTWPTNFWFAQVHGRMITQQGVALNHSFPLICARATNSAVTAIFQNGQYLVWANWIPSVPEDGSSSKRGRHPGIQVLAADGSRAHFPIIDLFSGGWYYPSPSGSASPPRFGFGTNRFCALSFPLGQFQGTVMILGAGYKANPLLFNPQRSSNGVLTFRTTTPWLSTRELPWDPAVTQFEYSTDLVVWTQYGSIFQVLDLTNQPRLFVRSHDGQWTCMENLRSMAWAKQQWAFEHKKSYTDLPVDSDIFGPGKYLWAKPECPNIGTYSLQQVATKPTCTVTAHTL